jgi:TolB-like protein/DNA-binding winged helix-turn-helix (wHTH) protein
MRIPAENTLRFGAFTLDPARASLAGPRGEAVLRPKTFDVLLYLARHPNRVVSKNELMEAVWPNVFVTENSLVQCISEIRSALGEEGILKTVARRGYMLAAPVTAADPAVPAATDLPPEAGAAPPPSGRPLRSRAMLGAGGLVLPLAVALAGWWWLAPPVATAPPVAEDVAPQKRLSIAVLPFTSRESAEDEYLADGLTEDIIGALARFSDVSVLAPKTVAPYKGRTPTREEIARDLKVRYLAEGSVRRGAGRLRISVRLADALNGALIWARPVRHRRRPGDRRPGRHHAPHHRRACRAPDQCRAGACRRKTSGEPGSLRPGAARA